MYFFLICHNITPIPAYNQAFHGRKSQEPHTLKISQSEGSERQKTNKMLDNWNNHEFSRSQGIGKNFVATSGHAFVKSCVQMPWQGPFWGLSSIEWWASDMKKKPKQGSRVVIWCHQILQHLEAPLRLVCLTGGSMAGAAPQFPSSVLSGACFVAKCDTDKSIITGPWDKDCSFTDSHCFCLWFDTNYSFLPYFLPLRQFLNCGIVLCFIFPLLKFPR